MSVTLVTCYYPTQTKYPPAHCIHWAQDFLSLDAQIVLFTEPDLANLFRSLHKGPAHNLRIVELPFTQLDAWILWKDAWIVQHALDPEKAIHSPELYAIWGQKPFFVNRAIEINPFETEYFFWCDIGVFREGVDPLIQTSFPDSRYLHQDRILIHSVKSLMPNDTLKLADGIKGNFLYANRISTKLCGGGRTGCVRWLVAYRSMAERYIAANRFAGKDESVMLSAYLEDPSLAHIVKCNMKGDSWLYLTQLCSRRNDIVYELDPSYTIVDVPIVSVSIMGGLGNQMFQIATAYAHAKRCGAALQLLRNKKEPDGRTTYWSSTLHRLEPYLVDTLPDLPSVYERGPTIYSELPRKGNMYLQGYWQSPKYFSELRDEICALYRPSDSVLMNLRAKYNDLLSMRDRVVIVHARRTDYLKNEWNKQVHGPLEISYYKRTIESMMKTVCDPVFVLCSDDPLFWLEVIPHVPALQTFPFHVFSGDDDVHTLAFLTLFKYFIIANSTFSWWGVWLSSAERVYAPARWFGPRGPSQYQDIYDPSWILVE